MAKNLIPEICKMLGVELGEEFKIKGRDGATYKLTSNRLMVIIDNEEAGWERTSGILSELLAGEEEIVKLPWKPKFGEKYYSFGGRYIGDPSIWIVVDVIWNGLAYDVAMLDKGWVYRTREEAEAALPKVAAELGVDYEL